MNKDLQRSEIHNTVMRKWSPKLTKTVIRETVYDVIIHYDNADPRIYLKKRISDQGLSSVIRDY
jgi:hypothetical protein